MRPYIQWLSAQKMEGLLCRWAVNCIARLNMISTLSAGKGARTAMQMHCLHGARVDKEELYEFVLKTRCSLEMHAVTIG